MKVLLGLMMHGFRLISSVFWTFLQLGCVAFGGPTAHLAYFERILVNRLNWVSPTHYSQILALGHLLPGPSSSQVGLALGYQRAGLWGALAAWLGFTLPSMTLMAGLAVGVMNVDSPFSANFLLAFKAVTAAIVAQAVHAMWRTSCTHLWEKGLVFASFLACIWLPATLFTPYSLMLTGGLVGLFRYLFKGSLSGPFRGANTEEPALKHPSRKLTVAILFVFVAGFVLLSQPGVQLGPFDDIHEANVLAIFYQAGATVVGGGHVVLPLLQDAVVNEGFVSQDMFLAGYGAVQSMPGPLFSFAAFLGGAGNWSLQGWAGALVAVVTLFLPGCLLMIACLTFWPRLVANPILKSVSSAIGASLVGLLAAVWFTTVLPESTGQPVGIALTLAAGVALMVLKINPLWVVLGGVLLGLVLPF